MQLPAPEMVDSLRLQRLDPDRSAHAALVSLPVPPGADNVCAEGLLSQAQPIAWWPEHLTSDGAGAPRRVLVAIADEGDLPARLRPTLGAGSEEGDWAGPEWETRVLDRDYTGAINWETGELVLQHGDAEIGLRLGLEREDDEPMWWEWLQVEELWSGPACRAIRVGGYVSAMRLTDDHPDVVDHRPTKWTHRQHWLFCEVYALLFANGVVQVTARHVNNKLYDYGQDVPGLPIMAFRCGYEGDVALEGEPVEVDLGGATLHTEECATLTSPEKPGGLRGDGQVTIFRPYEAVEITLDGHGRRCDGPTWVCAPEEGIMPRGAARTVRFTLSLSDAPPRVERYVVPWWWLGLCAELVPDAVLPVRDERDVVVDTAVQWLNQCQLRGFFNDGSVPRGGKHYYEDGRARESGWEGEAPFNHIRSFYRNPTPEHWRCAMRDLDNCADIAVDHASFMFRMHGYDFGCISITMNRTLGLLQGYLETGDPYLAETAENVAMCSAAMDRSNWPRRSYGRDAMWIRGPIALADYFPGRGYTHIAREALGRVIQCQREEGAYTDQGGPGGAHAAGNMILKPWMNFMVLEPMIDWLERHPEDEEVTATARRIFDWQMAHLYRDEDDRLYWPYQVKWGDNPGMPGNPDSSHPYGHFPFWYPARAMLFAARRFGDPRYLEAWEEVMRGRLESGALDSLRAGGDHHANKAIESVLWHQLRRWNARWINGQLVADPFTLPGEDLRAIIETPEGPREVGA
ncbi:MAG: hypothetical protein GF393_05375 [Armatimonadia bacterium]|nr:hypothetical protein [Armatimonadia bacterium]